LLGGSWRGGGSRRAEGDRLASLAGDIEKAGGTALAVETDITNRAQAHKAALAVNKNDAPLTSEDVADGLAFMVTRPRHAAIGELWIQWLPFAIHVRVAASSR
jgi:NADP-dependent 3-hydroxy acid dehydrogenase YdfG